MKRLRLDAALVERQLVETRSKAQALVLAGKVTVDGQRADKPGHAVSEEARIEVEQELKYVSRGGLKLEAGLQSFAVDPASRICLDVGTSTGGFADCLLQHGAARVHCVDTGAGQIHWKLRTDSRIVLHESFNARYLTSDEIGERASLLVCDVSFISVTLLIPALVPILNESGEMIILVSDDAGHQAACDRVTKALEAQNFETRIIDSPILGAEGNKEFLLYARRHSS